MEYLTLLYVIKGLDINTKRSIINFVLELYYCGDPILSLDELDEYFEISSPITSLTEFLTSFELIPSWVEYFTQNSMSSTTWLDEIEAEVVLDDIIDNDVFNYMHGGHSFEDAYREAYEMYV